MPAAAPDENASGNGRSDGQREKGATPLWLSLLYTTGMLLIGLGLPGAPIAALCLYFEGSLDWPDAVRAACWLVALVALLGTTLWIAASLLEHARRSRAPRSVRRS